MSILLTAFRDAPQLTGPRRENHPNAKDCAPSMPLNIHPDYRVSPPIIGIYAYDYGLSVVLFVAVSMVFCASS